MELRISAINFHYTDGEVEQVTIRHEAFNADRTIDNHGHITITQEEYEKNKDMDQLVQIVRERLTEEFKG